MAWKIFSTKEKRSGVISSLSNDKAPSEENLLDITSNATVLFVTSIIENDFQKLFNSSAKTWQEEIKLGKPIKAWNDFIYIIEPHPTKEGYVIIRTDITKLR